MLPAGQLADFFFNDVSHFEVLVKLVHHQRVLAVAPSVWVILSRLDVLDNLRSIAFTKDFDRRLYLLRSAKLEDGGLVLPVVNWSLTWNEAVGLASIIVVEAADRNAWRHSLVLHAGRA